MLKARIIKSEYCPRCAAYLTRLDKLQFDYLIYDVDTGDKELLDKWRISDMPVVQIVDDQTNEIYHQFPFVQHGWSPRAINHKIKECINDH